MNRTHALLTILCTLVALDIAVSFRGEGLPDAQGQSGGLPTAQVALASVSGPNLEPWVYVYDVPTQRLACYTTRASGIELEGVRKISADLQLEELPRSLLGRRLSVKEVQAFIAENDPRNNEK